MYSKRKVWLLIIGLAALCGIVVYGIAWWRVERGGQLPQMMRRIPRTDAVILYADVVALRSAGIMRYLQCGTVTEEPDYRDFVSKTEFDYRSDVDAALVSFAPEGTFFVVKGRFGWKVLKKYALSQGGDCYNVTCKMAGSTASRKISFFSIESSLMGLAVSPEDTGAERMKTLGPPEASISAYPFWLKIPPAVLKSSEKFPAGTKMFARTMGDTDGITIGLAPEGDHFAAKLDATCRSEAEAATLASELNRITLTLQEMIARESQKPNPADLSGVLTSGKFEHQGSHVNGGWVLQRSFLQNLFSCGS